MKAFTIYYIIAIQNLGSLFRTGFFHGIDLMIANKLDHGIPETVHRASACASLVGDRLHRITGLYNFIQVKKTLCLQTQQR